MALLSNSPHQGKKKRKEKKMNEREKKQSSL